MTKHGKSTHRKEPIKQEKKKHVEKNNIWERSGSDKCSIKDTRDRKTECETDAGNTQAVMVRQPQRDWELLCLWRHRSTYWPNALAPAFIVLQLSEAPRGRVTGERTKSVQREEQVSSYSSPITGFCWHLVFDSPYRWHPLQKIFFFVIFR